MAGLTFVTQAPLQVSTETGFSTRVTQAILEIGVTTDFDTRTTQVIMQASAWTAYYTRVTQAIMQVWVIACDSSSYVPPAPSGLITLVATSGT